MKQRYTWKRLAIFGLVFCVLLAVCSIPFYGCLELGYQYQSIQEKTNIIQNESDESYDALFLGDSQGWSTYSPIQIYGECGFTSYNACTSGQFPYDAAILLKNFYETKTTQLVVLDVNMVFSSVNLLKLGLMWIFPIFHYHNMNNLTSGQDYSSRKGFNENEGILGYSGSLNYMNESKKMAWVRYDCSEALEHIYELCNENGSELVLVNTVAPLNWNQKRHDKIQEWCDEHDVNYVDYNESSLNQEIGFDYSLDFRDGGDHLNLNGSKKVCTNLGKYLQNNYGLADHRKDNKHQEWNTLYEDASEYH